MKVLLTGAKGQIGSEIGSEVASLSQNRDIDVSAFSREQLDITDKSAIAQVIQSISPDVLINAAAYTAVDRAEEEQDAAFAVNCRGVENLAEICNESAIPVIHLSTDYIFDGKKEGAYMEDDSPSPLSVYGESKWQGEQALRRILIEHIILRVSWIFGTQGNNFVKTMLRVGKDKKSIDVIADKIGCPTPAKDVAETLLTIVRHIAGRKENVWGTYHYCGSSAVSWYDFAKAIFMCAKERYDFNSIKLNPIHINDYPFVATRPVNSALDCHRIQEVFGIEPVLWQKGLDLVIGSYLQSN